MYLIHIPGSVTQIGGDVFEKCVNLSLVVEKGSYGERYAKKNRIEFIYEDN